MSRTYDFLLETYESEILKTTGIWRAFPDSAMDFRPHPKSRNVIEQMEHQAQSEGRWMTVMLGIDTGDPNPAERTSRGFIEKYSADARRRLEILREKPDQWWRESHHRGQLAVCLRLLDLPLPSVYGPTADTGDRVIYSFADPV